LQLTLQGEYKIQVNSITIFVKLNAFVHFD